MIVVNDAPSQDGEQVGHEVGSCVLVDTNGTANCTGVVTLDGRGTIAFAFENAPPPEKVLSITGTRGSSVQPAVRAPSSRTGTGPGR